MKHAFVKWSLYSALVGLFVPASWFLIQKFVPGDTQSGRETIYHLERVVRVIWPSSIWLMATDGIEGTPRAYLFIFLSVAANVLLYVVLGSGVWAIKYFATASGR